MTQAISSPIGAHAFIWSPRWDRDGARRAATRAAAAGYEFVEIPLLSPSLVDVDDTVRLLEELGLGCTCSTALPRFAHLPARPKAALSFLTHAIDVAADLGSSWLTGALYASLGTLTGQAATPEELDVVARTLERAAAHADGRGINLGVEVINRYETHLLNTADQAIALIDRIGAPNVSVHLDTFHMNIEEASFADAIRRLGHRIGYVHLAESNRGVLGQGNVPFREVLAALAYLRYGGPLVVEAFVNASAEVRVITASWRDEVVDAQEFAVASLEHILALRQEHSRPAARSELERPWSLGVGPP